MGTGAGGRVQPKANFGGISANGMYPDCRRKEYLPGISGGGTSPFALIPPKFASAGRRPPAPVPLERLVAKMRPAGTDAARSNGLGGARLQALRVCTQ